MHTYYMLPFLCIFTDKPNPVAAPLLYKPRCEGSDCSSFGFKVEWNHTDYYHSSLSSINYNVYISYDGVSTTLGCVNVHGTSCVVPVQLDPVKLGMYAASVETVYDVQKDVPPPREESSERSNLSNSIILNFSDIPGIFCVKLL